MWAMTIRFVERVGVKSVVPTTIDVASCRTVTNNTLFFFSYLSRHRFIGHTFLASSVEHTIPERRRLLSDLALISTRGRD